MSQFFLEGGPGMYLTALLGLALLLVSALHALRPLANWGPLLVGLFCLVLASGMGGFALGLSRTLQYLPNMHPDDRFTIFAAGLGESLNNLILMLLVAGLAGIGICVGGVRQLNAAR